MLRNREPRTIVANQKSLKRPTRSRLKARSASIIVTLLESRQIVASTGRSKTSLGNGPVKLLPIYTRYATTKIVNNADSVTIRKTTPIVPRSGGCHPWARVIALVFNMLAGVILLLEFPIRIVRML